MRVNVNSQGKKKQHENIIMGNYKDGDHIFDKVNQQKDLGTIVDSKLNFNDYITAILSKGRISIWLPLNVFVMISEIIIL